MVLLHGFKYRPHALASTRRGGRKLVHRFRDVGAEIRVIDIRLDVVSKRQDGVGDRGPIPRNDGVKHLRERCLMKRRQPRRQTSV